MTVRGSSDIGGRVFPGVVVMGCPRSGTSMLASMMESRFDYAAPVESHFVRYFDKLARARDPRSQRELAHFARAIHCFLLRWVPVNNRVRSAEHALAYSLASVSAEWPDVVVPCRCYRDLVGGMFSAFAIQENRQGWVEQSVYAEPASMAYLDHYPEGTRFIHLVRDGRDVWSSWRKTWFRPASLEQAANWWRLHVQRIRSWGQARATAFLEIRYEDLVEEPERVLLKISDFLDAPLLTGTDIRDSGLSRLLAAGGTHDRIGCAASPESVGRWRNEMSARELARFESIAADQLQAFGYGLGAANSNHLAGKNRRTVRGAAVRGKISSNNAKRQLKRLLPLYCMMRTWKP